MKHAQYCCLALMLAFCISLTACMPGMAKGGTASEDVYCWVVEKWLADKLVGRVIRSCDMETGIITEELVPEGWLPVINTDIEGGLLFVEVVSESGDAVASVYRWTGEKYELVKTPIELDGDETEVPWLYTNQTLYSVSAISSANPPFRYKKEYANNEAAHYIRTEDKYRGPLIDAEGNVAYYSGSYLGSPPIRYEPEVHFRLESKEVVITCSFEHLTFCKNAAYAIAEDKLLMFFQIMDCTDTVQVWEDWALEPEDWTMEPTQSHYQLFEVDLSNQTLTPYLDARGNTIDLWNVMADNAMMYYDAPGNSLFMVGKEDDPIVSILASYYEASGDEPRPRSIMCISLETGEVTMLAADTVPPTDCETLWSVFLKMYGVDDGNTQAGPDKGLTREERLALSQEVSDALCALPEDVVVEKFTEPFVFSIYRAE